ncbi:hypothetical protein DM01DRAFT_1334131 [Hesseltinella vesiculosa]|uniref:Uncharacterized protein n=1 Tax=Hesseltinella vesiculosa TaxID=101127 RepID=A0A1X2GPC3_9FUNG|nr:hypothetical protein DM01DRAFT_1334131 [Hesseltinella vesiculosa]
MTSMATQTDTGKSLLIPGPPVDRDSLPTPSSSYCHSFASKESKVSTLFSRSDRLASSKVFSRQYGSFLNMPIADDTISFEEAPPTPPTTTINPNDDDEGLYLLWTSQILRDHGIRPASLRTHSFQDVDEDDDDDDESSQSSFASIPVQPSWASFFTACFCPSSA